MAENKVRFLRGTAAEYANAVKDDDTFYYTTDDEKFYVGGKEITNDINKILADYTYALKSKYGDTTINVGRRSGTTVGDYSTAEGRQTIASGKYSHAEGSETFAIGVSAHAEGSNIRKDGSYSDLRDVIINDDITITVIGSQAYGINSHAEGCQTLAYAFASHSEGQDTLASSDCSHAEGWNTKATANDAHAEGNLTIASGESSHAEGISTTASGESSHAEGISTTASGESSHAEGNSNNRVINAITDFSVSTSNDDIIAAWNKFRFSLARGSASHVEGYNTLALAIAAHAEGDYTKAVGVSSHAEGTATEATGNFSHAEGYNTTASGKGSSSHGYFTKALHNYEASFGAYNESNDNTIFSVGDGTADDARHNAFEITTDGGKLHDKNIAVIDDIPSSLPANGGNADTVNGHTVNSDVPANAVFTDTTNSDITASGNPVQLSGLQGGVPFSEITVSGDDIVGHDLTVNVSGKNLLKYPYAETTKTVNGITFTDNGDGTITANGTATANATFLLARNFGFEKEGNYFLSGCPSGGGLNSFFINWYQNHTGVTIKNYNDYGSGIIIPYQHIFSENNSLAIAIIAGTTVNNLVFRPQIELGSTATPYEPYHGSVTTITPTSNPYIIPNDIRQVEGLNNISVSAGELSVVGVRKNAAIKRIWDKLDELTTAIIVSNGESE